MATDFIKFVESCPPSLNTGEYKISVTQEIQTKGTGSLPPSINYISIKGPRFQLSSNDIFSVYPAANHIGKFDNCLPHLTLSRRTLPWERTIDGTMPKRPEKNSKPLNIPSWLALLTFHSDEAVVSNTTLTNIIQPGPGIMGPQIQLDALAGEKETDICTSIDLSAKLFQAILPRKKDLLYLAHARKVSTDNKEITGKNTDGWFSIIIGNRLPLSSDDGTKNCVHLVSLEGFGNCFKEDGIVVPEGFKTVRMVSLMNWSFTSINEKNNFKEISDRLSPGQPLRLNIDLAAGTAGQREVKNAFQLGYIALNHSMQEGEKAVSWYRGPLVPIRMVIPPDGKVYPCADSLMRYNPDTGLFDTSYASAWQLGRLLALENKSFALSLFNWRRRKNQKLLLSLNKKTLLKKLNQNKNLSAASGKEKTLGNEILTYCKANIIPRLSPINTKGESILGAFADPRRKKNQ